MECGYFVVVLEASAVYSSHAPPSDQCKWINTNQMRSAHYRVAALHFCSKTMRKRTLCRYNFCGRNCQYTWYIFSCIAFVFDWSLYFGHHIAPIEFVKESNTSFSLHTRNQCDCVDRTECAENLYFYVYRIHRVNRGVWVCKSVYVHYIGTLIWLFVLKMEGSYGAFGLVYLCAMFGFHRPCGSVAFLA